MNNSQILISLHPSPCPPLTNRERIGKIILGGKQRCLPCGIGGWALMGFRDSCKLVVPLLDVQGILLEEFQVPVSVWSQESCRLLLVT